jgi:hypothetical protein
MKIPFFDLPCTGFSFICSAKPAISFLSDGYFFAGFFASDKNSGVALILKGFRQ